MFFRKRTVPQTPPSFVKFWRQASEEITGAESSAPRSDHVPELRMALVLDAETAANAEPVSWHAGATTGVPAKAAETDACRGPSMEPDWTIGGRSRAGRSSRARRSTAQERVRASRNCVVLALVYSQAWTPVSQKFKRSGIVRNLSAAATVCGVARHAA